MSDNGRRHYALDNEKWQDVTLVDCCVCRKEMRGVGSPSRVGPYLRLPRAAWKDPCTGLSYCKRCAGGRVRVVAS